MRQGIIDLHFHDLGIDHDKAEVLGAGMIKQGCNDSIDTHGFPGAGRPGDQQVGHFREVGDQRLAGNILSEGDRNFRLVVDPVLRLEDIADKDRLRILVGHLHTDAALSGNGGQDAHRQGLEVEGDVLVQVLDPLDADAGCRIHIVARDHRAGMDVARGNADPEFLEGLDQHVRGLLMEGLILDIGRYGRFREQPHGGKLVIASFLGKLCRCLADFLAGNDPQVGALAGILFSALLTRQAEGFLGAGVGSLCPRLWF